MSRRVSRKSSSTLKIKHPFLVGLLVLLIIFSLLYIYVPENSANKLIQILRIIATYGTGLTGSTFIIALAAQIAYKWVPKKLMRL